MRLTRYLFAIIFSSLGSILSYGQNKISKHLIPGRSRDTAFIINEKNLIPECITYDQMKKRFFIGSMYKRKIIAINKNGKIYDFIKPGSYGLNAVLGIKADRKNRVLWVLSDNAKFIPTDHISDNSNFTTAVFKFDIENGKLLKKYIITDTTVFFNDLSISENNDVFITNTFSGSIYRIEHKSDSLKVFLPKGSFDSPNGISSRKDELYIADDKGVSIVNMTTKKIQRIITGTNSFIGGIDGLYAYNKDQLIAIQNEIKPKQIIRIYLDWSHKRVTHIDKLFTSNLSAKYYSPTTGTIIGNAFYYILNAQSGSFDKSGKILPNKDLAPLMIKKIALYPN
jgi:hypothetical protein